MSVIPEELAGQSPMTIWHVAKACDSISSIWPETDEETGITTYPEPPDEHQIKWLELAVNYYGLIPEDDPKGIPSLWNKALCIARLSDLQEDGRQTLQDAMGILDDIPTRGVAPIDGRALGHEARVRRAFLTLKWAAEYSVDSDYEDNTIRRMVSDSIEGLRKVPQSSEHWSAAASFFIDLAGTAMYRLDNEETEEESIDLLRSAIKKSSIMEPPHKLVIPSSDSFSYVSPSNLEHLSRHWVRSHVNALHFLNILTGHYSSKGRYDRARETSDFLMRGLDHLTNRLRDPTSHYGLTLQLPRGFIPIHPEHLYAEAHYARARLASEGDEELDEIEELRSFIRHTDALLDENLDTPGDPDWLAERRVNFGLYLLGSMASTAAPKEEFDSEAESLSRRIESNSYIQESDNAASLAEGVLYETAQHRLMALLETLDRDGDTPAEITARVTDLNLSLKALESKAAAYRTAQRASMLHDQLYLHEDRVMDEELSNHVGMNLNQLSHIRRGGAAELLATTINATIRFDVGLEWEAEGHIMPIGERYPFFPLLITDSILTYVALGYQDEFGLMDEVYEIPEILRDFSESKPLATLCSELGESLVAAEAEGDSADLVLNDDHRNCESICRIYLSWRAKGEIEELTLLEAYCSLHPDLSSWRPLVERFHEEGDDLPSEARSPEWIGTLLEPLVDDDDDDDDYSRPWREHHPRDSNLED